VQTSQKRSGPVAPGTARPQAEQRGPPTRKARSRHASGLSVPGAPVSAPLTGQSGGKTVPAISRPMPVVMAFSLASGVSHRHVRLYVTGMEREPAESPPPSRPPLIEHGALARRRDRAMRRGFAGGADFLWRVAAEGLAERIEDCPRDFPDLAIHGTGAGAVAAALPPRAGTRRRVQIDPSPRMAAAASCADPGAETRVDDGETLPLEEGAHDLALSVLMLHWANDPVGDLIQLNRALRPDGLMLAALFGGRSLSELRTALATAEAEISGGLSPRVAPMGEIRDLGALLQRAGYAMPVADAERLTVRYGDPLALMRELRAMGETNILDQRHRAPLPRRVLARACEIYVQEYADADGRVPATVEIVYLTGWAPAEGQPRPLRPGSAGARLADALGAVEIPVARHTFRDETGN